MLAFVYYLNLETSLICIAINHINFNSTHHDKFRFVLNLILLLSISILFSLEAIQKCQCCQLCVKSENSYENTTGCRYSKGTSTPLADGGDKTDGGQYQWSNT